MSSQLDAFVAAEAAIDSEKAAFFALIPPTPPTLTLEQHRAFRKGGAMLMRELGFVAEAAAKEAYCLAFEAHSAAKATAGADLQAAKQSAGYDQAAADLQSFQAAILAIDPASRTTQQSNDEAAAHAALGRISSRISI